MRKSQVLVSSQHAKPSQMFPGGNLVASLLNHPNVHFTFQKHFITKMNERRKKFKLNKLHKYLKSQASQPSLGIVSAQVRIRQDIEKY